MAYQVVSTLVNARLVLEAFADFAVANGWTQVYRTPGVGATTGIGLQIPGTTDYVHLWNDTSGVIYSRVSVGYDPGQGPTTQPGSSPSTSITNTQGPGPYPRTFMFAQGTELDLIILNPASATYAHIALGMLTKYGAFDGGTYADGTYFPTSGFSVGSWSSQGHGVLAGKRGIDGFSGGMGHIRADTDGRVNTFHPFAESVEGDTGAVTGIGPPSGVGISMYAPSGNSTGFLSRLVYAADDNTFSGRSILQPIEISVRRAGTTAYLSPAGYIKNRHLVSLAKFEPEQEVAIAGETWKMFPVVRKAAMLENQPLHATGNIGYALRIS